MAMGFNQAVISFLLMFGLRMVLVVLVVVCSMSKMWREKLDRSDLSKQPANKPISTGLPAKQPVLTGLTIINNPQLLAGKSNM